MSGRAVRRTPFHRAQALRERAEIIAALLSLPFLNPEEAAIVTLAIAHRVDDAAVLDLVREVRPAFSPEAVVTEFASLLNASRQTSMWPW